MRFKEIEFKYSIPFTTRIPKELLSGLVDSKFVAGFDYYYTKGNETIRFRDGDEIKELTTKVNHRDADIRTVVRDEVNLELKHETPISAITRFCNLLGFRQSLQIYKQARIFYYEDHIISQYTVKAYKGGPRHDSGSYFEIEIRDGAFQTQSDSVKRLEELEKQYSALGLSQDKRVNKSLYEIYA